MLVRYPNFCVYLILSAVSLELTDKIFLFLLFHADLRSLSITGLGYDPLETLPLIYALKFMSVRNFLAAIAPTELDCISARYQYVMEFMVEQLEADVHVTHVTRRPSGENIDGDDTDKDVTLDTIADGKIANVSSVIGTHERVWI